MEIKSRRESDIIVVRGAGDLATGTIHRLYSAGFHVLALETAHPLTIRRYVAFSEAVVTGETFVEGIRAVRVEDIQETRRVWETGNAVPVMVDPEGSCIEELAPFAVVDAILAKKNLGTNRQMASLTIALGPGFSAGEDVDYVIETMRGHNLGRIIRTGRALPNTGVPGIIGGYGAERVIHAPASGILHHVKDIGDTAQAGEVIAWISSEKDSDLAADPQEMTAVFSQITGLIRGMIRDGTPVRKGLKIADVDPRTDQYQNCFTISDKARCIAGSVLELICAEYMRTSAGRDRETFSKNAGSKDSQKEESDSEKSWNGKSTGNGCPAKVGCVLMAAGWSRRFGSDKLMTKMDGEPMIARGLLQLRRLADALPEAEPHVIARRREISSLAKKYGLDCTLYEGGMQSDTIRKALEVPGADQWTGCMFIPADQPLLTAESMEMLLRSFLQEPDKIHRLCAKGVPGNPVIFPASCFTALRELQSDVGGRAVLRQGTVPVRMHEARSPEELLDADAPGDLEGIERVKHDKERLLKYN